jgi:hypothetical protein
MKKIDVKIPNECPFRYCDSDRYWCVLKDGDGCLYPKIFPLDCPLKKEKKIVVRT